MLMLLPPGGAREYQGFFINRIICLPRYVLAGDNYRHCRQQGGLGEWFIWSRMKLKGRYTTVQINGFGKKKKPGSSGSAVSENPRPRRTRNAHHLGAETLLRLNFRVAITMQGR